MEPWMWLMIGWIAGGIVGFGFAWFISWRHDKKLCVGTLRMDHSDPEEAPYLFLELEPGGMDSIHRNKTVNFRVNIQDYIPRKESNHV